jgi:predicted amidophosphoribosyltransferase
MIQLFKNFLAPKKCYGCKKIGTFFCLDCQKKCDFFVPICYVCKKPSENFSLHDYCKNEEIFYDGIFVTLHYKNKIIKKLVKDAKFYHKQDILEDMSEIMYEKNKIFLESQKENLVFIATPMYFLKKIFR